MIMINDKDTCQWIIATDRMIIPLTLTLEGMLTLDWDKPGMAELGGLEDGVGILESPAAAADTAPVPVALELFLVLRGGIAPICTALRLYT